MRCVLGSGRTDDFDSCCVPGRDDARVNFVNEALEHTHRHTRKGDTGDMGCDGWMVAGGQDIQHQPLVLCRLFTTYEER